MAKKKTKKKAAKKIVDGINVEHWLKNKLRRISYQWVPLKEAVSKARVSRGKYRCASCGGEGFGPKQIQRDHILSVDDPETGFTTWDNYISRLFCSVDGIQILCKPCHSSKTFRENVQRKLVKNEKDGNTGDL